MSFAKNFRQVAVPAATAITLAFAANANAASQIIEPSTADLSKPVDGCVKTTPNQPGLTAYDKLVTIMNARGQMVAVSGNKLGVNGKGGKSEVIFTVSNNFSGREGYIIASDATKENRKQSDGFCISPVNRAMVIDTNMSVGVPKPVDKGELGIALTNHDVAGSKTAVIGMHTNGALFVVHFNAMTHKGALKISNGEGYNAGDASFYEDMDYSPQMKQVFATGIAGTQKPSVTVAAATPAQIPK